MNLSTDWTHTVLIYENKICVNDTTHGWDWHYTITMHAGKDQSFAVKSTETVYNNLN